MTHDDAADETSTSSNRKNIFISYRWNETKDDVRALADGLTKTGQYNVWIDTAEMYGDKNERMEEGIRQADVVIIFFNDDYQKSRDCRKEAESADRNSKKMLFVKMQRSRSEFQAWFAPIISSNIFIDFFKFQNPLEEIKKHLERLINDEPDDNGPTAVASTKSKSRFVTVKVPKFGKYQQRSDEVQICEAIRKLASNPEEGALVICGGGGTGKTTLLSQLIHNNNAFFHNQCNLNATLWLNCFKWTGDGFDENEIIRALIDLAEKASDYSGFRSLTDVCEWFEKQREHLLFVLDDVFNVQVLELVREQCPSAACLVITRDVDSLSARHGLVNDTYRLHELDTNEIIEMFEMAYRLKGKLAREQLSNLANQCSGLPIVVSLIAARFQDCESIRDFAAEYELVMEEVKVKDLKIMGPYGTVSKLFEFSIQQLEESQRISYYAFLLFNPAEPVDVEDLAVLWNCANPHRALVRCRQLAKKSLARPVGGAGKQGDFFLVHQILHEAAVDNATKTHKIAPSLAQLRCKIITGFAENDDLDIVKGLELLVKCVKSQRKYLLETIFRVVDIHFLEKIVKSKSPDFPQGKCFLHYLYGIEWPDDGPKTAIGANGSLRLIKQLVTRFVKYNEITGRNQPQVDIVDLLTVPDDNDTCFLVELFNQERRFQAHKYDRRKLVDFITPIKGVYQTYKKLDWLLETRNEQMHDRSKEIFIATGKGDLEAVKALIKSPGATMYRNGMAETPMMIAAMMGYLDIVKYLAELHPDDNHMLAADSRGKIAFQVACHYGNLPIVEYFYETATNKQALLEHLDSKKRRGILLAALNGALDVIKFLYNKQPEAIGKSDASGKTAFIQAARYGHIHVVKFLVEEVKRDHDKETCKNGQTPLMFACKNGRLDIVKLLCSPEVGADINKRDSTGASALIHACNHGHLDIVQFLYDLNPDAAFNQVMAHGKTPFLAAVEHNEIEVVKFLYSKAPNEAARFRPDRKGETALMHASRGGLLDAVKIICGGTDVSQEPPSQQLINNVKLKNRAGHDALSIATQAKHEQVAEYLRRNFYDSL